MQKGFEYLKGFAPETILTAILFSMLGYFNGNNKTLWVMAQGLIQTLLVRLPFAYVMSIQPNASLTKIGLAAPVSTLVGVLETGGTLPDYFPLSCGASSSSICRSFFAAMLSGCVLRWKRKTLRAGMGSSSMMG